MYIQALISIHISAFINFRVSDKRNHTSGFGREMPAFAIKTTPAMYFIIQLGITA